jgi:hypothetical protein
MNDFAISAILNIVLIVMLIVILGVAKRRMVEEKMATFAGCLGAITSGIAFDSIDDRSEKTALGLSFMKSGLDKDELVWRLVRAGFLRLLRAEPTLTDIGGEYTRELFLRSMTISERDDQDAKQIWAYIDSVLEGNVKLAQEPRDRFGDDGLAKAQYQIEAQILAAYRAEIETRPPKLFI